MSIEYKAWVSETGTLTGTDPTYTLPGTASTPSGNQFFRKVSAAFTTTSTIVLTITAATGAETSVWTYTPGASGAAGTITRGTLLESSTGSTINWSGVTANISGDIPSPVLTSAGAASAGLVPALGTNGLLDWSATGKTSKSAPVLISGNWYDDSSQSTSAYTGWTSLYLFIPVFSPVAHTYQNAAIYCTTAPTAATSFRIGFYADTGSCSPGSLIVDQGAISVTTTGAQATGVGVSLPQGWSWACIGTPSTMNGGAFAGISQNSNVFKGFNSNSTAFDWGYVRGQYGVTITGGAYTTGNALPATAVSGGWNGASAGWAVALQA